MCPLDREDGMSITPFKIAIPEEALVDLKRRLAATRWPDAVPPSGWAEGTDPAYLREIVDHWRERFDWRAAEAELNRLPQFRADLDGFGVHFVHQRGKGPAPLPLLITHGWPGSFIEMTKILPLLTDPGAHGGDPKDAFDLVIPSLPGYGFSDQPKALGMNVVAIAQLWTRLMSALGYARFGAQGGDWGAAVTLALGLHHPDRLVGVHFNFFSASLRIELASGAPPFSEEEKAYLSAATQWLEAEGAYGHIQGTRPQTLAYGLADSPAGLAGWILEKFQRWSDCDGHPENCFSRDELLTNLSIYWLTNSIHSSFRLYAERRRLPARIAAGQRVAVPAGAALFPKEIVQPPRSYAERFLDLRRWSPQPRGGHFAAMEQPHLLAEEIRAFFRPLRG